MAVDLAGSLGDIFWDLPPWITYMPGSDIGCVIYVANPTGEEKEYALMSHLSSEGAVISEESVTVFGYSWFKVDPGDFIKLRGAFRFENTNVMLTLSLIERESDETTDAVATFLAQPAAAAWPPEWPGAPGAPGETGALPNWSLFMTTLLPIMMLGMVAGMVTPRETQKGEEERKLFSAGRGA